MASLIGNYEIPPWNQLTYHPSFKFAPLKWALTQSYPWVAALINHLNDRFAPLTTLPYTVVDVKYWSTLSEGEYPCIPGWHVDCVRNIHDPNPPELHLVYQAGAGCFTQFENLMAFEGSIIQYSRDLHTCTPAIKTGPRLFVRVTKSARIKGVTGFYQPARIRQ